ncbi:hydroxymethylbilane synthase [Microlunatus elymi]|uniref:Hydroxymethylbilane synthase n=1 Tax=Microlunatus elymi TaxID=2596828 RepID=A0A516Q4G6_9ACTN|nr:hydroxymethylbilane synthase [Microlunatus elymi]QDP98275.1 hydroxymethylbilane synthase [Microlunatus elymi]
MMIRIGARNSPLARAQVELVAGTLAGFGVDCEFVPIQTQGDVDRRELTQIGGTGVFTAAVRDRLLDGGIDVAVHSLKDLPTADVDGLEVVAYPPREDTHEVLVARDPSVLSLSNRCPELVEGDRELDRGRPLLIGTGAPRRAVQLEQLAAERGVKLAIEPIRGNVDTRLQKVRDGRYDATVLAAAGLRRLHRLERDESTGLMVGGLPAAVLPYHELLPAPGQGALAVEAATTLDSRIRAVLTRLNDAVTRAEVLAERRFLAVLEAGCTAPVGARASLAAVPTGAGAATVEGLDSGSVRDAGTDLTLVAVIGRTRGDEESQRSRTGTESSQLQGQLTDGEQGDSVSSHGRLVTISGSGHRDDPIALGSRLAQLALSVVDPSDFRTA